MCRRLLMTGIMMTQYYQPFCIVLAMLALIGAGGAQVAPKNLLEQGVIKPPDYPRVMGFRILDRGRAKRPGGLDVLKRYDMIHSGVGVNPAIRAACPGGIFTEHWRMGLATRPGDLGGIRADVIPEFAGHWLLYNGASLTADLDEKQTVLRVSDTSVFAVDNPPLYKADDLMIYARDARGLPDWSTFEHCILVSIDAKAKMLNVKRGQYRSTPRAFKGGRAVVSAHATPALRSHIDPKMWRLNFSVFGPRDANGRLAAERAADIMAEKLKTEYPHADGVEFDVGDWDGRAATGNQHRGVDCDNDLKRDDCFARVDGVGPVNAIGLGTIVFTQRLRERLGERYIIQSESQWRGFPWGNGIEVEGYPVFPKGDLRMSNQRFEHARFAAVRAGFEPKITYLFVKRPTEKYSKDPSQFPNTNRIFRMGFASAMMLDGFIANASVDDPGGLGEERGLGFDYPCWWDEYDAGKAKRRWYLGAPLGPPVFHDAAAAGENVLSDSEPKLVCQPEYEARLRPSSSGARINIAKQASPPKPFCVRLVWRLSELRFEPYTLRMRVRANPGYENIDPRFAKVSRMMRAALPDRSPVNFLADGEWWDLVLTLPARKAWWMKRGGSPTPELRLELGGEPGWVEVRDVSLCRGDGFAMWRRFANGLVLLNGTAQPVEFDLKKIGGGRRYRAIAGEITPKVNDGAIVAGAITIGPYDGRSLLAN